MLLCQYFKSNVVCPELNHILKNADFASSVQKCSRTLPTRLFSLFQNSANACRDLHLFFQEQKLIDKKAVCRMSDKLLQSFNNRLLVGCFLAVKTNFFQISINLPECFLAKHFDAFSNEQIKENTCALRTLGDV